MIIIAIDGPSGAGKGTIARHLAQAFHFAHIDSGLLYRHAALASLSAGLDAGALSQDDIHVLVQYIHHLVYENLEADASLRLESTANVASAISTQLEIRDAVNAWLHKQTDILATTYKGVIVDGRDIGTVVFPKASIKFYVTADEDVRVKRRFKDTDESPEHIVENMTRRDKRDSTRKMAPLSIATDAFMIDTTHLSIDDACKNASEYVTERCFRG